MHYYPEDQSTENLKKVRRNNVCAECGRSVAQYLDMKTRLVYIACSGGVHEGVAKEYKPPVEDYQSNIRRSMELEQQVGTAVARSVGHLPMQGQLDKEQAMNILKLVYPNAPEEEIVRCAILCRDFGLHPLMKEVYLIPFGQGAQRVWATVIGISASRKMAANSKGAYSFLDGSPRAATSEEIIKQFGKGSDEEKNNLISICLLKGEKGNEATGFGLWPKNQSPYGTDKGNTPRNMANIRSERPAYSRLPGGVLPPIEVIDEAYAELPDISGKVDKATGEIIDVSATVLPEAAAPEDPVTEAGLGMCPIHNKPLIPGKGHFPPYCPTRVDGVGRSEGKKIWCRGKLSVGQEPAQPSETVVAEPTVEVEPALTPEQVTKETSWSHLVDIGELFTRAKNYDLSRSDVFGTLGIEDSSEIADLDDAWQKVAEKKGFKPPVE